MKKLQRYGERFKGWTLGLDLHKKFIQYSLLDEQGDEQENQRIDPCVMDLEKLLGRLTAQGRGLQVAMEASSCVQWVFDLCVTRLGREQVHVAAPSKVAVIAQSPETDDDRDSWWLAYLLYERRLPQAFIAEGELRELRIVGRELRSVTDERSDLMRRLRSHLMQLGQTFARNDWSSEVGRQEIQALVDWAQKEHGMRGQAVAHLWRRIGFLDQERAYWLGELEKRIVPIPEVKMIEEELPGLGPLTAGLVWAEMGDPRRYHAAKAYGKATGLTPGYRESGGKRSRGKITRQGSALARWALTRAAMSCMRCRRGPGLAVKKWMEKRMRHKPKKAVFVAAARKLAEAIWRLFALGEAFDAARAFGGTPRGVMAR